MQSGKRGVAILAADVILIFLAILTPPVGFFGSFILTGAGHGPSIFWDAYFTPAGFGFFLPSIGAFLVAFSSEKGFCITGATVALLTLLLQANAFLRSEEGFSYIEKALGVLPVLTWSVAVLGPLTCALSIAAGCAKIEYSRRRSKDA